MTEFSETSLKALKIIKKHKKGISITELAKLLGVAKSNLGTRHLRPLKDAGLVSKNFKIGKDFCVKSTGKKLKKTEKEVAAEEKDKPKSKEPRIDEIDIWIEKGHKKEFLSELAKEDIKLDEIEATKKDKDSTRYSIMIRAFSKYEIPEGRFWQLKSVYRGKGELEKPKKPHHKIPREPAEIKATIIELTKPERRAKIKEAKKGLIEKKYAEWWKKQQFQKFQIGWFEHRPAKAAQFLRYLINIGISGGERYKISKTYGGMSNYRATMNQLISFLEQR